MCTLSVCVARSVMQREKAIRNGARVLLSHSPVRPCQATWEEDRRILEVSLQIVV